MGNLTQFRASRRLGDHSPGGPDSIIYIEVVKQGLDGSNRQVLSSTGFIISERGFALTAAHAVPGATEGTHVTYRASVRSRYAPKFHFEVVDRNDTLDIALLQFPNLRDNWPNIKFGQSANVPLDARLYVLGFPRDFRSCFGRRAFK